MPKHRCPICGDPQAFPLWSGKTPPDGCPSDSSWAEGGPITIRSVVECPLQMKRAQQAAEFRRLVPDAFDARGVMRLGQLARVLQAYGAAHPGKALTL